MKEDSFVKAANIRHKISEIDRQIKAMDWLESTLQLEGQPVTQYGAKTAFPSHPVVQKLYSDFRKNAMEALKQEREDLQSKFKNLR